MCNAPILHFWTPRIHAWTGGQARTLEEAEQAWKKGSSDTTEPTEQGQLSKEKFDWLRTWYPLAIERDLPTDRPTPARLLGNAVVLWKDGDEQWRAFKDLCPHRSGPASQMTSRLSKFSQRVWPDFLTSFKRSHPSY